MKLPLLLAALTLLCASFSDAQSISPDRVYPKFSIGPSGVYVTIEKGLKVTIQEIAPDCGSILIPAGAELRLNEIECY